MDKMTFKTTDGQLPTILNGSSHQMSSTFDSIAIAKKRKSSPSNQALGPYLIKQKIKPCLKLNSHRSRYRHMERLERGMSNEKIQQLSFYTIYNKLPKLKHQPSKNRQTYNTSLLYDDTSQSLPENENFAFAPQQLSAMQSKLLTSNLNKQSSRYLKSNLSSERRSQDTIVLPSYTRLSAKLRKPSLVNEIPGNPRSIQNNGNFVKKRNFSPESIRKKMV